MFAEIDSFSAYLSYRIKHNSCSRGFALGNVRPLPRTGISQRARARVKHHLQRRQRWSRPFIAFCTAKFLLGILACLPSRIGTYICVYSFIGSSKSGDARDPCVLQTNLTFLWGNPRGASALMVTLTALDLFHTCVAVEATEATERLVRQMLQVRWRNTLNTFLSYTHALQFTLVLVKTRDTSLH